MSPVQLTLCAGCGRGISDGREGDIQFNGYAEDGYEYMVLKKNDTIGAFNFCKTARKPYDGDVVALLCIAHHHAPGALSISSDGSMEEWKPGMDFAEEILEAKIDRNSLRTDTDSDSSDEYRT